MPRPLVVILCALGCGNQARPPQPVSEATPASPRAIASGTPACTPAALLVDGEGAEDRPPPEGDSEETKREIEKWNREQGYVDPLAGVTIGETCTITGKLAPAEGRILATPVPAQRATVRAPAGKPQRLGEVTTSLRLSPAETQKLGEHGMVALDRFPYADYTTALYEVYRRDLPLYVGVDPILHAHFVGHDSFLRDLEESRLVPTTAYVLESLACALPVYAVRLPVQTARDLDLYLAVARALLDGKPPQSTLGDAETVKLATGFVQRANAAAGLANENLWGRVRVVDWSQWKPRGHYAGDGDRGPIALPKRVHRDGDEPDEKRLERYFRAVMWLSRVELDIGGTGCPVAAQQRDAAKAERETLVAYALAELVGHAGVGVELGAIDRGWAELAGPPEAARLADLAAIRTAAGVAALADADAARRLRAAATGKLARTVRTSYVAPTCAGEPLPPVASLIAPRIGPDAQAMMSLSATDHNMSPAELAFALGHDRARAHLEPTDDGRGLEAARKTLERARGEREGGIYGAWLDAVLALADRPAGVVPALYERPAGQDHRIESALVAYAQLRHDNVLLAAQTYGEDACSIPDGYVEPAPQVFGGLATMAERGAALAEAHGMSKWTAHWKRMAEIDRVLERIARHELAGAPLTKDMQRFLEMIVEIHDKNAYGGAPAFNGWYFDMFRHDERDAFHPARFGIDVFTAMYPQRKTTTIGAAPPVLGVFEIETNGVRRVVVGPMARALAGYTTLAERGVVPKDADYGPDDGAGGVGLVKWRKPFAVDAVALDATIDVEIELPPKRTVVVNIAPKIAGTFVVELLGANRKPIAKKQVSLAQAGKVTFALPRSLGAVHVQAGDRHVWLDCRYFEEIGASCDSHNLIPE